MVEKQHVLVNEIGLLHSKVAATQLKPISIQVDWFVESMPNCSHNSATTSRNPDMTQYYSSLETLSADVESAFEADNFKGTLT